MNDDSERLTGMAEARELAALQAQMQRPAQNLNKDGGFELGWGLSLLCLGLAPYFSAVVTKSSWFSAWTAWIAFLPFICAAFAPYAVPKMIKRFITWPRTGYFANPDEVTLKQLVLLLVFGSAVGASLGQAFVLLVKVHEGTGGPGRHGEIQGILVNCIGLVLGAILAAYLGPKVIRKRKPAPAAYDAALITQGLKRTAAGRKRLRVVKFTLITMFLATPILVCGVVYGLMYSSRLVLRHGEIHWSQ
ncbi:MAG: hypothetical protein ACREIC_03670, partial [Limisphaerales bacterium]